MGNAARSDYVLAGQRAATPTFAAISAAASGQNTLVAAAGAGLKIRVLGYVLVADAAVTAQWRSGATTALSGAMAFANNGGLSAPEATFGHFETAANEALTMNLGAAVGVRGHLTYIVVA
jgi:hypothetical protein